MDWEWTLAKFAKFTKAGWKGADQAFIVFVHFVAIFYLC